MNRVVIFGAGREGSILFYTLSCRYKIVFFIDSRIPYGSSDTHLGVPVYDPKCLLEKKEWDFVVLSSGAFIGEMSKQLSDLGLEYGKDFLTPYDVAYDVDLIDASLYLTAPASMFREQIQRLQRGRQIAFVYGNCQTEVICHLLAGTPSFSDRYLTIKLPPIFYDNCEKTIRSVMDSGVWRECTLFITQVVKKDNRFSFRASTEYLLDGLHDRCKIVKIPNLYFRGYWPDVYDLDRADRVLPAFFGETGLFASGYREIDRLIAEQRTLDEMISALTRKDLYSRDYLVSTIEREIKDFSVREKEQELSVVISDHMMKNYDRTLLFHCFRHPSMELITELTRRILQYLGLGSAVFQDDNQNFHCQNYTLLLYPSVIAGLGLDRSYEQMVYYPYSGLQIGISFKEYVYRYINYMGHLKR